MFKIKMLSLVIYEMGLLKKYYLIYNPKKHILNNLELYLESYEISNF